MSPLARSLLALACAALLHDSSAVHPDRMRAVLPNLAWFPDWPCAKLDMGIEDDKYALKVELPVQLVPRHTLINVTNVAKPDQALIGQHMLVCDKMGAAKKVILNPLIPNKHSPIRYTCLPIGACHEGVVVLTDQYVIQKLL